VIIFDFLSSVLTSKKHIELDTECEKEFNLYMMNRWLSMYSSDVAALVNSTTNKWWSAFDNKQEQYDFLFYLIAKSKFKKINYIKKTAKKSKAAKTEQEEIDRMIAHANFMSIKQYQELQKDICM
jgi:hypothetical protein